MALYATEAIAKGDGARAAKLMLGLHNLFRSCSTRCVAMRKTNIANMRSS